MTQFEFESEILDVMAKGFTRTEADKIVTIQEGVYSDPFDDIQPLLIEWGWKITYESGSIMDRICYCKNPEWEDYITKDTRHVILERGGKTVHLREYGLDDE